MEGLWRIEKSGATPYLQYENGKYQIYTYVMYLTEDMRKLNPCILLSEYFVDRWRPTEEERAMFELEHGIPYPTVVLLGNYLKLLEEYDYV